MNYFILWLAITLTTIGYTLLIGKKLTIQALGAAFSVATGLGFFAYLLPLQAAYAPPLLQAARWLAYLLIFSALFRFLFKFPWRRCLGAGFFSATCVSLLYLFG